MSKIVSYDDLFNKPFNKSTEWDRKYIDLKIRGNKEEIDKFLKETNVKELYDTEYTIQWLIYNYTLIPQNKDLINQIINELLISKSITNAKIVHNDRYNTNELVLDTNKGKIKTMILSEVIPGVKELIPEIETNQRKGKCFYNSITLSTNLEKDNKLVTGYIYGQSDKAKYLHSVIEMNLDGIDYIIDVSSNSIINKDEYNLIKNFEELNKINNKDINEDNDNNIKIFNDLDISYDVYNVFRDELIKDIDKTKKSR